MFEIPGSRSGYYQWDLNQRLYVRDGSCNEVHFCSEKHPESLACLVQEESGKRYVQVPNILLQSCLPITAFFYVKGTDGAYTKKSVCIEVWERPKPDDYVYTETEVKTWESAVEYALQEAKVSGAFKGERGEKGDKGDKGDTGEQGPKGEQGDPASTIICKKTGTVISLMDASEQILQGLTVYGKTTQDGTPTSDAPVELVSAGDGGNIEVAVYGENLAVPSDIVTQNEPDRATITSEGNVITLTTDPVQNSGESFFFCIGLLQQGKTYTISGNAVGHGNLRIYDMSDLNSGFKGYANTDENGNFSLEYTPAANNHAFRIWVNKGTPCVLTDFSIALKSGENGYKLPTKQTIAIPTPNGLPGIPVTSGGNYTDENGQQYLANIAGYVQDGQVGEWATTGYIESYDGEAIPGVYLSSTGGLDAGAFVRYALETPVFVPYDEDSQAQWKVLHTNKLNTTIYNDAGTWMQVSYAADTKTYIDNKFAELAAAIVNNT